MNRLLLQACLLARRPLAIACNLFHAFRMLLTGRRRAAMEAMGDDAKCIKSLEDVAILAHRHFKGKRNNSILGALDFSDSLDVVYDLRPSGPDHMAGIYRWLYANLLLRLGASRYEIKQSIHVFLMFDKKCGPMRSLMAAHYLCVVDLDRAGFVVAGKESKSGEKQLGGKFLVGDYQNYAMTDEHCLKKYYAEVYCPWVAENAIKDSIDWIRVGARDLPEMAS